MSFIRKIKRNGKIYLAEVENKWIDGKCVQKHIRYVGKEVNGKSIVSISFHDLQVDSVKIYGPLIIFHHLAQKIKLTELFGDYSNEILSMVYAHCLNYKSMRNMPKWYQRTDLNLLLNLEGLTESRLVSAMSTLTESKIDEYQKAIFKNVKKAYNLNSKGIVYDVTNTYFHGTKCKIGKIGRSKDGRRQNNLIQIALGTTKKDGIPVFHKTFKGNIHDSKTLLSISNDFEEYGFKSGLFIYDRGIVSEKNLNFIGKIGWSTLCAIPMREKEKVIIRRYIKNGFIDDFSKMVPINKSTFYIEGVSHSFGSMKGKLAICYNEEKKMEVKESRRRKIFEAQKLIKGNKKIGDRLKKYLTPTGRLRPSVLEETEEFDGFFCLFCTKNIPNEDMIRLYLDKDVIEKAFQTFKGVSNVRPIRFWLDKHVIAHVFICYLSYLLLSTLNLSLKNKKVNLSVGQAIEELEDMYNVYLYDKKKGAKFVSTVTLNQIQEKIIRAVNPKILKNRVTCSSKS